MFPQNDSKWHITFRVVCDVFCAR